MNEEAQGEVEMCSENNNENDKAFEIWWKVTKVD